MRKPSRLLRRHSIRIAYLFELFFYSKCWSSFIGVNCDGNLLAFHSGFKNTICRC